MIRMMSKKEQMMKRAIEHGILFLNRGATIRNIAEKTGYNKSTVHLDLHRLKEFHPYLYEKVKAKLDYNSSVRHIRAGEATRKLYEKRKKNNGQDY